MPKFLWALCCDKVIIDQESNNLSLIGVIEQFNLPEIPLVIPQLFQVVIMWEKDTSYNGKEEPFSFKIVITPKGRKPLEDEGKIYEYKIPKDKKRFRNLCGLRGIPIEKEGTLFIRIFLKIKTKWDEVYKIPLEIKKIS
jgi:hypothetical protein